MDQSAAVSMPIKFGGVAVDPQEFVRFSRYALMVISTFSGMIISLINRGSIKGGIKFVPLLFIGSQLVYFIAMKIGTSVFAGFFT